MQGNGCRRKWDKMQVMKVREQSGEYKQGRKEGEQLKQVS